MRFSAMRHHFTEHVPFVLAMPAYLWQMYFLIVPLFFIAAISFVSDMSSASWFFTLAHYGELVDKTYFKVIFNSALLSCLTGALCLFVGYPVAYYIAMKARRFKQMFLVFLILPSWTSFVVQIYSWFYLLQKHGMFSNCAALLHLTDGPVSLLNNYGATLLGMVYCYLPFMVLPLYTVLEKMDKRLLEAAADLGASPWQIFSTIVLPLSRSGIKVGLALVMVPAFGEFAIPDLMGGVKDMYLGRVIMEKFLQFRNWHSGAAVVMLSFLVPIFMVILLGVIVSMRKHLKTEE